MFIGNALPIRWRTCITEAANRAINMSWCSTSEGSRRTSEETGVGPWLPTSPPWRRRCQEGGGSKRGGFPPGSDVVDSTPSLPVHPACRHAGGSRGWTACRWPPLGGVCKGRGWHGRGCKEGRGSKTWSMGFHDHPTCLLMMWGENLWSIWWHRLPRPPLPVRAEYNRPCVVNQSPQPHLLLAPYRAYL